MRRWHAERELMLRRWRLEIAKHEQRVGLGKYWLAPVPPQNDGDCHCYLGMGFLRKKTPFGCPNGRYCGCCGIPKEPKRRAATRRTAINYDLQAYGD